MIIPVPTPVWRGWIELEILIGQSNHHPCIVQIWHLLNSLCSGWWKMDSATFSWQHHYYCCSEQMGCRLSCWRFSCLWAFVHRCWWCAELVFCSRKYAISTILIMVPICVKVYVEVNGKHFFWSILYGCRKVSSLTKMSKKNKNWCLVRFGEVLGRQIFSTLSFYSKFAEENTWTLIETLLILISC